MSKINKIQSPNLEYLRSFRQVCISGSILAAVKDTGVPRATLSRHITALETDLSSILFIRGSSGFIKTELGETVFEYAESIFEKATGLSEAVLAHNLELLGPIKIVASSGIASVILPSIVANINFASDGLQLEIIPMNSVNMDSKENADIAIQTYRPIRKDLIARKLGEIEYGIYASTKYINKKGVPQSLEELKEHFIVGTIPETLKQKCKVTYGQELLEHENSIKCQDYPLIWQLVVAGCGIGLTHRIQGDADPTVKRILTELNTFKLPVWLVAQPDLKKRARLKLVYNSLADQLQAKLKDSA